MKSQSRKSVRSMPSLTTWLVVFLILFLLVMVLVFSQYRKKAKSGNGGFGEMLLGNSQANLFDWIDQEVQNPIPGASIQTAPRLQPAGKRAVDLTPNTGATRKLRPIQGYGFQLADQLMIVE